MPSTNKTQAYIVAHVSALDVPLPFDGYLKLDGVNHYTLNEIDNTDLLGHHVSIRKSLDGQFFIYSDSNFSYRKGHFDAIKQMGDTYGITLEILTTMDEVQAEINGTAGVDQISTWKTAEDL